MIEEYEVNGWNTALNAIGLSYNDEFKDISKSFYVSKNLLRKSLNSGELNFLTGVNVNMRVNASIKWWQQAMRYHWFQIVMSQSVMHAITHRTIDQLEFTPSTPASTIDAFAKAIEQYKNGEIDQLGLIYSVPVGLKEKARVSTNYLQLLTMVSQRKNHKLLEWQEFCNEVSKMPYMDEILALQYPPDA